METTESTAPTAGAELDTTGDASDTGTPSHEVVAREKGWRPKEEYEGDPETWVAAEEFVKRQPLFDKIKVQSKKLKELEKTVEALAKHYQTNLTQAKERAILDLKAQRKEAIEVGDAPTVDRLDEQIDHVKQMSEPVIAPKGLAPEIEQFVSENSEWFNKDQKMTRFAVAYNESYLKENPGAMEESLKETIKAVKQAFPDKFANTKRVAPPAVEGASAPSNGAGKYAMSKLNAEQKMVYNQLVRVHKQMSHDDYFRSLDEAGFLES